MFHKIVVIYRADGRMLCGTAGFNSLFAALGTGLPQVAFRQFPIHAEFFLQQTPNKLPAYLKLLLLFG